MQPLTYTPKLLHYSKSNQLDWSNKVSSVSGFLVAQTEIEINVGDDNSIGLTA